MQRILLPAKKQKNRFTIPNLSNEREKSHQQTKTSAMPRKLSDGKLVGFLFSNAYQRQKTGGSNFVLLAHAQSWALSVFLKYFNNEK